MLRRILTFISVAAAVVSCGPGGRFKDAQPGVEKAGNTLNIATYNVGVFNKSGSNSMDMVAAMMKEWDLDILGLNELDSCNTRSGSSVHQLRDFASKMGGWSYNFAAAIPFRIGTYGIGAVSRMKPVNCISIKLPKADDKEVRALSVMEFDRLVFCNTHLGLTSKAQAGQVAAILEFIEARYNADNRPVILCGDMNAEPGSATLKALEADWEQLSATDMTFSTSNPSKCIDYIFRFKRAGKCSAESSFVGRKFTNGDTKTASDHFPVFARIKL